MTTPSPRIYGYFGHHKCASTWFVEIFSNICLELGLRYEILNKEQDFGGDLAGYVADKKIDFVSYTNAQFSHVATLRNLVGVHAVRDPRDIVVSAYFSHLKTHSTETWPELIAHRALLQQSDQAEGLMHEIAFRRTQFEEMGSWKDFHGSNIMQVRMEDVTTKTYQSMLPIVAFLGLLFEDRYGFSKRSKYLFARLLMNIELKLGVPFPRIIQSLPAERVLGIVWQNEFEKKTGGRKLGEENQNSHYRKGIQGDWKNYLTPGHLAQIDAQYGDLIQQLGYEPSQRQ